jgi:hypothetical protein
MSPRHRRTAGGDRFTAQLLDDPRPGGIGDVGEDQQALLVQLVQLVELVVHRMSFLMTVEKFRTRVVG